MRKYKQLNTATMTPGSAFDTEHNTLAYDAMLWQYSATIAGSPATVAEDGPFRMMGTPEIDQAEEPIVRIEGRTLRHLSAYLSGGYSKTLLPTSGGILAEALLDFGKILPGAYVSGEVKTFVRGNVEPLASYSTTAPTGLAGNLRNQVATIDRPPGLAHPRPFYREVSIGIPSNDAAQTYTLTVDQDVVSAGLFLLVRDASTGGASGGTRVDTLLRALRIDVTRAGKGQEELIRETWGQARSRTARMAGFTDLDWDEATGTAFIPFVDEEDPRFAGRMAFSTGDTIQITLDSNATIEEHLGTALTAAAGDHVRVVRLEHSMVPGLAMGGDMPAPIASRTAVRPANGRRRRRRRVVQ